MVKAYRTLRTPEPIDAFARKVSSALQSFAAPFPQGQHNLTYAHFLLHGLSNLCNADQGAIGVCLADTVATLNLSPSQCQLWEQFAYSNFEENGCPPGGWKNWRQRILNQASRFSFSQPDLLFRMTGPTTQLELARLGSPTSVFA